MSNLWDHGLDGTTGEISRWHSLVNVVAFLTDEFSDTVDFGTQLFPSASAYLDERVNAMSCQVLDAPEVAVGPFTGPEIIASIPEATDLSISGGTPATASVQSAIEHLESLDGNAPAAPPTATPRSPRTTPCSPTTRISPTWSRWRSRPTRFRST